MLRRRSTRVPDPGPQVYRISSAPVRHSDDLSARMHRYLVSMAIRTGCVVLVVLVHGPLRWVFAVGAIGLPYIAVVMANASRRPREPGPASPGAVPRGELPPRQPGPLRPDHSRPGPPIPRANLE